ncbi:FIG01058191: hypothetical protein [hydrothermal vent metagenome]|uniref:TIGR02453 family protein n=1 Tax=hydrothermal vent metagenome TaxID=652676 RepID=A0A3B0YX67_9ZZZZ
MADCYFTPLTFEFLLALAENNRREWFEEHRDQYEERIRTPALNFIDDMSHDLAMISPHFLAVPKKMGGSLMRIHRDVRFGKDKRPYKTNIGIQFRHETAKDVHAPGYYLHIEPGSCFIGVGIWRPDSLALGKIRDAIVEKSDAWLAARDDRVFSKKFKLEGDRLKNPPRGYTKDHPLIEELKRKDFIAISSISDKAITNKTMRPKVIEAYRQATPLMKFLCKALGLRY